MTPITIKPVKEQTRTIEGYIPCVLVFTNYPDIIESDIWLQFEEHEERVSFGNNIILNRK